MSEDDGSKREDIVVTAQFLLEGAVYSLQNCGVLLRDASALCNQKAYPSAIALALFGREELGKYGILRDFFELVAAGGTVDLKTVRKQCATHLSKQERGMFGIVQRFKNDDPIGKAVWARMQNPPGSPEYIEAEKVLAEDAARNLKETPKARHDLRLSLLYVEPLDDGSGWERPQDQTLEDAKFEIWDAVNSYSGVLSNLPPGHSDSKFAEAYHAWKDRPELLPPVWPER